MSNKEYWSKRLSEVAQTRYEMSYETMKQQITSIYDDMGATMQKEIEDIYFRLLEDNISRTDIWTYKHYRDLAKRMAIISAKTGGSEIDILNKQLEIALNETYKATKLPGTNLNLINETITRQIIATPWAPKHFSQSVWDNKQLLIDRLKKGVTESIILGKSKDKAVSDIMEICKKGFHESDRVVRSELMHVINAGQREKYRDNGYKQLEILVAEDERLCEKCESRNGDIIDIDSDDIPPFHACCRCTTIPVIEW